MGYIPEYAKCFGEAAIGSIDKARERFKSIEESIASVEENEQIRSELEVVRSRYAELINEHLNSLRERLRIKLQNPDEVSGAFTFFDEAAVIPELSLAIDQVMEKFPENNPSKGTFLAAMFMNDTLDNSLFEPIIRNHLRIFQEKEKEFERYLPHTLADFRDSISEEIKNGDLPIDIETLEARMGETRVYLVDSLQATDHVGGDYSPYTGIIRIIDNEDKEKQYKVIFHEMVHVLSGRTLLKKNKLIPENKPLMSGIDIQRQGLTFETQDVGQDKFRWLNEAVTEDIATSLSKIDTGAYNRERKMLQELIDGGVPRELIYKAYFENYDVNADVAIPAWKELTMSISEKFPHMGGAQKLLQLDEEDKKANNDEVKEITDLMKKN